MLKAVLRSTIILSLAALVSRVVGFLRDILLSYHFGAISQGEINPLDAYYAAFRIPDFIYNVLVVSAGMALLIPLFTDFKKKHADVYHSLVQTLLVVFSIGVLAISLLIFVFAPYLVPILTGGFSAPMQAMTVDLTRIMLLSPIFFTLSTVIGSYLCVERNFISYSISPILYNVGIIIGIVFLLPSWGVYGVAMGVVIGAMFHALVQLPFGMRAISYKVSVRFDAFSAELSTLLKLAVPRVLATSVNQVALLIDTVIGAMLTSGSITLINLLQNVIFLPIGLIGLPISIASFVVISEYVSLDEHIKVEAKIRELIAQVLYLVTPIMLFFVFNSTDLIYLVFGRGKFVDNISNVMIAAVALQIFCLSIIPQSLIPIITKAFFSYKETWVPFWISLISVVVSAIFSYLFAIVLGLEVYGLAISFAFVSILQCILLYFFFHKRIQSINWNLLNSFIKKYVVLTALLALCLWPFTYLHLEGTPLIQALIRMSVSGVAFVLIFCLISNILGFKEWDDVKRSVRLRFAPGRANKGE